MEVNDKITLKKKHPCGSTVWTVMGMGADVKLKCDICGRIVLIPRDKIDKMIKSSADGKNGKVQ